MKAAVSVKLSRGLCRGVGRTSGVEPRGARGFEGVEAFVVGVEFVRLFASNGRSGGTALKLGVALGALFLFGTRSGEILGFALGVWIAMRLAVRSRSA